MIVEVKDASIIRNSTYILKNINWSIKNGEHWAMLGLNGSGKTSLLNMLNGYIFPSTGQVTVLGKSQGQYDLRELRKSIGWVSSSIQEKLHGYEKAIDIVLSGKFATIGLYDEISPEDMDLALSLLGKLSIKKLEKRIYESLSQGEKQRVLIARGLMAQPDLLILDEPCTGLDIFARELLLKTVEDLSKEEDSPTIIYVTHHIEEILPSFSHSILLKKGEIYSSGPTSQILTSENLSGFFDFPIQCQNISNRYFIDLDYESLLKK